jgi:peptidyl-prolyl cis-trans isomerase D
MLDALRRGSTGWVAKILLALLVVSFAVWGVADVFTGYGRGSIATVGDTDIAVQDFQRSFQNEISTISQQAGRRISADEARAAGLDNRVLSQLMAWAAVEQHANDLDLALSDQALAELIRKDPNFKGPDGSFSQLSFENIINRMGLSERGFLDLRRRDELREQVITALMNSVAVPEPMVTLVNNYDQEKRVVEYFKIDAEKVITVPEPDETKLKQVYENNKTQFVVPEQRKLAILAVSPESLMGGVEVTEEEIASTYEDTKADYNTPERRRLQQIAFKDKAAAEAAKKALTEGKKTFGEIAADAGAKSTDIDLGLVSKDALIDPKIADAAFALEKDEVSDVVEGQFATVLIRTTNIEPAVERTLDQVKTQVRDKIARQKAEAKLQSVIDEVEDNRAAGKTLKETAEIVKVDFMEVPATDRYNKGPDGQAAVKLPDAMSILKTSFDSDVGLENEPVELRDGGYAWVDVVAITPPKQKPFDEVKEEVKKLAIESERARFVAELADKLVERANKGESMDALAKEAGAPKAETSLPFTRTTDPHGLSKDAVKVAFKLKKGDAGSALASGNQTRLVLKLTEIKPAPELTTEQREKISKDLRAKLTDEVLSEYVIALQNNLGTSINQTEFRRATGAETE